MRTTRSFANCPCSGRNIDKFLHAAILTLLQREPLHGYEIVRRLADLRMFRGRGPDRTGVYRLIRQMERDGLVCSTLQPSARGPRKRSNELTADGERCLLRWRDTLAALQEAVGELLEEIRERPQRGTCCRRTRRNR